MPPLNRETFVQCSSPSSLSITAMPPFSKDAHQLSLHDEEVTTHVVGVLKQTDAQPIRRRRKSVRFDEYSLQYPTIGLHDFSSDEIRDTWYSPDDFTKFCSDLSKTMDLIMNEPEEIDDIKYTARGAECRSVHATKRRRMIRFQARHLVFEMQKLKTRRGCRNEDMIAYHYGQFSLLAAYEAIIRGDLDSREANKIRLEEFKHFWGRLINVRPVSPEPTSPQYQENNTCSQFDEAWLHPVSP